MSKINPEIENINNETYIVHSPKPVIVSNGRKFSFDEDYTEKCSICRKFILSRDKTIFDDKKPYCILCYNKFVSFNCSCCNTIYPSSYKINTDYLTYQDLNKITKYFNFNSLSDNFQICKDCHYVSIEKNNCCVVS
jgi:hypothetical protein